MKPLSVLLYVLLIAKSFQVRIGQSRRAVSESCWYNCGYRLRTCSCENSCRYQRNCCYDYNNYCNYSWPRGIPTAATTDVNYSCQHKCGIDLGKCSCYSSCQYHGNCCPDFNWYCPVASTLQPAMTKASSSPTSDWEWIAPTNVAIDWEWTASSSNTGSGLKSTGYNECGGTLTDWMGEFFSPQYPSNYPDNARCTWTIHSTGQRTVLLNFTFVDLETCCDYIKVFDGHISRGRLLGKLPENRRQTFKSTQNEMTVVFYSDVSVASRGFHANWIFVDSNSCRYNCGYRLSTCSCENSCRYKRNCCHDYNDYCYDYYSWPGATPAATTDVNYSCQYNCGMDLGNCSCYSLCQYHGNCCPDFKWYCPVASTLQPAMTKGNQCGGHLYGSGQFFSPNYPNSYYNNANCVWYLSAQPGQRIVLSFANVQLENCCSCDYISVHDGSSTGYPELGSICVNDTTNETFHSSSQYMTVVFRSDYSVVNHGFKALFTSSLTADKGRVDCSSDNMVIVIQLSYLNLLGFNGNDLYVDDHQCRPTITSNEVVFRFPLDTCGSGREIRNGCVTYTNNVRASKSQSDEITRQSQFLLRVSCRMEPETMVQILYKTRKNVNASIMGTGHFNASMAFYSSSSFNQKMYDSPYEVNLNQNLYVQVQLNRADRSLNIFLDTCVASPDPNEFQARSYYLLRNGCSKDSTYFSYNNGQQYYARFHFKAFKFLRTHASVYLQCKVIICPENDYNSRCRQGCRWRRKRSLESNHHTNTVILGPIKLRDQKVKGLV